LFGLLFFTVLLDLSRVQSAGSMGFPLTITDRHFSLFMGLFGGFGWENGCFDLREIVGLNSRAFGNNEKDFSSHLDWQFSFDRKRSPLA